MEFPLHVIFHILSFLSGWEMFRTMNVSKAWKRNIEEMYKWEEWEHENNKIKSCSLKEITLYNFNHCITKQIEKHVRIDFINHQFDFLIKRLNSTVGFEIGIDEPPCSLFFDDSMILTQIGFGRSQDVIIQFNKSGSIFWIRSLIHNQEFDLENVTEDLILTRQTINSWIENYDLLHFICLPTNDFKYTLNLDVFSRFDIRKTKFFS
jgi:hypothetical protein